MRKKMIMISHNCHTFFINEINYAINKFDELIVICPFNIEIYKQYHNKDNIKLCFYNKRKIYFNVLKSLPKLINEEIKSEIKSVKKAKLFSVRYIKTLLFYLAFENIVFESIDRSLEGDSDKHWIGYSGWFSASAYALIKLKRKYKNLYIISLAHSFEIDEQKNIYYKNLFKSQCHNEMDQINFISSKMRDYYEQNCAIPLNLDMNKTNVCYLGCEKKFDGITNFSNDKVIRIVSCSHVVKVKRVDLIYDSLSLIKDRNIEWIHFGEGSEMEKLKSKIKIGNQLNTNIKVTLFGSTENSKIHEYFSKNSIDCFINVSSSEGVPISLMEAIAYGIPIIATDVGGNSEIANNNVGRIIFNNPTPHEVKEAILDIISLEASEKEVMKQNAYNLYKEKFDITRIRPEFFEKLINS